MERIVEEADERTIWTVKKYLDTKPTQQYIGKINNATSDSEKAQEFHTTFFPPPPEADLSDIEHATYPEPIQIDTKITIQQLERAINKLSPKKAPGPDEITNAVLKRTFPTIQQHLLALIQTSLNLGHFPQVFKKTTTVVLRKPTKPDYSKPNAYRPIALESTGQSHESIIAELLSYVTETHQLIPAEHFGGRPGRTGEEAMVILSERIYAAWKEREIYSAVFMDVAGAFNNVHHDRLEHDLRKRKVPEPMSNGRKVSSETEPPNSNSMERPRKP
jgi:Reverse transcriptase (RNA-dependent DNA polymerase).